MKKPLLFSAWLLAGTHLFAQHGTATLDCDCETCRAKAASGKTYTMPELQGLLDAPPPAADTACPHDAQAEPADHDGHDHGGQGDHDPADHGESAVELSADAAEQVGIRLRRAEGGTIARISVFPAEIKLNRDRTAAVSPRYPSLVRQVFAEIGDAVRQGDVLAALENRETLAVYTVSAPQDGVIIAKDVAAGEIADAERILFEVADLSTVWADISIFPQYQHRIRKGATVTFVAHDGHAAQGTVQYISPIISHETRTFTARCILEGARDDFTPGAFVRARIGTESVAAQVVVPREAVQTLDGETVVFVPEGAGFAARPVRTGLADGDQIEIVEGLEPGSDYVAAGAFALKAQLLARGIDPHAGHGH